MPQVTLSAAAQVLGLGSERGEPAAPVHQGFDATEATALETRLEAEATYCSRRAREERQASSRAASRKCREVHLELAMAYEFRAHLFTQQLRRCATSDLYAL